MTNAYLVLGAESSGNRLMTRVLIAAGCAGVAGAQQALDDAIPPADGTPIVWLRSVPHGRVFPDIAAHIHLLDAAGYCVRCVVMHRDFHAQTHSQVAARHVQTLEQAQMHVRLAYQRIYAALSETKCWYVALNYEALVQNPDAVMAWLLPMLDLPIPLLSEPIRNENEKWYASLSGISVSE